MAEVKQAIGMIRYFEWVRAGPRQQAELREKLRASIEDALARGGVDVALAVYHYEDYPGEAKYERDPRTGAEYRVGLTIRGEGPLADGIGEGVPV